MSTAAWYGDVPDGWESVALRYLAQSSTGGTPDRSNSDFWDGDIPWVSPKDMDSSEIKDAEEYVTEEAINRSSTTVVPAGSILVVARSGILDHSIPVAVAASPVAINQDIRAYTLRDDSTDPEFLQSFIVSHENALLNLWRKQGATVQSLDSDAMADTKFPIPSIEQQQVITNFLNRRTTRIDALIAKQKRFLDLLDEKRQAFITRTVTGGLDSTVATKKTETEWLDEIPENWAVSRLKYLRDPFVPIVYGIILPGPNQDEGVPIIKGGDCETGELDPETLSKTTPEKAAEYQRSRLSAGDLVYEIRGSVGRVVKVPPELEGANLTQDTARISPSEDVNGDWLLYALRSEVFRQQMDLHTRGATVQGVNLFDLRRGILPVPPLEEQRQIAHRLKEIDGKYRDFCEQIERVIALLQEKRQALITAGVTGQIDVTEERGETQATHR